MSYKIFILILMILFHIIEDFHLQGILSNLKQKKWWENECRKNGFIWETCKYKKDYFISLIIHSLENSIFIMLPLIADNLIYTLTVCPENHLYIMWILGIISNTIFHSYVDHVKCNRFEFNLIIDQFLHLLIILIIFLTNMRFLGKWIL